MLVGTEAVEQHPGPRHRTCQGRRPALPLPLYTKDRIVTDTLAAGALAPDGVLRAVINLGNAVLARRDPASGALLGVSVDLARELARQLGAQLSLVAVEAAARAVEAVRGGSADIGFFAVDPLRGAGIAFSAPYLRIEGAYLVRTDSNLRDNDQVDRAGVRIVVSQDSAYDLYLSRAITAAQILRAPLPTLVMPWFHDTGAEVAAGIRPQLQGEAQRDAALRLLPGRFMVIEQAMGIPAGRGPAAQTLLRHFVDRVVGGGFVAQSLARHGQDPAMAATAAP